MAQRLAHPAQLEKIEELSKQVHPGRLELLQSGFPNLTPKAAKKFIKLLKREAKNPDKFRITNKDELTKKLEEKLLSLNPTAIIPYEPFTKRKAIHYRNKLRNLIREAGGKPPLVRKIRKRETRTRSRTFYLTYIKSQAWEAKKAEFRASRYYRGCCYVCDSANQLDIHHDTYVSLGNEKLEDLLELCRQCHEELHQRVKRRVYRKITGSAEKMRIEWTTNKKCWNN